jgi:hypothetical protein
MNTSDRGLPRVTAGRRHVPIAGLVHRYRKCGRLAQLQHFVISSLHIPVITSWPPGRLIVTAGQGPGKFGVGA